MLHCKLNIICFFGGILHCKPDVTCSLEWCSVANPTLFLLEGFFGDANCLFLQTSVVLISLALQPLVELRVLFWFCLVQGQFSLQGVSWERTYPKSAYVGREKSVWCMQTVVMAWATDGAPGERSQSALWIVFTCASLRNQKWWSLGCTSLGPHLRADCHWGRICENPSLVESLLWALVFRDRWAHFLL